MRAWLDVYDAAGNRLGDGPVRTVESVTVTRKLDGAGGLDLVAAGTDPRALALLTGGRHVVALALLGGRVRELGRGVVRGRQIGADGASLAVRGPDELSALGQVSTLLGRAYTDEPLADVIADLVGLVPGWSATTTVGLGTYSGRFDGESVLKAIQTATEQQGVHFRQAASGQAIEVGALGDDSGLWIVGKGQVGQEIYQNDDVALIEALQLDHSSEAVANWIIPVGGGEGAARLTLAASTRTTPYAIESLTGPDGNPVYYLRDTTSIAAYGLMQRRLDLPNIVAASSDPADVARAADMLYDAAAAWLARYSLAQDVYDVTAQKAWARAILPGQKVHIRYRGFVYRDGATVDWLDVDEDFWALEVVERLSASAGQAVGLKLGSVDRLPSSAAQALVDAIDTVQTLVRTR